MTNFIIPKSRPINSRDMKGREVGSAKKVNRILKEDGCNSAFDDSGSTISQMCRDKTMRRMIRDGKGSDKGLLRAAEAIERENMKRPKEIWHQKKRAELDR